MTTAQVLSIFLLHLGVIAVATAYFTLAAALMPRVITEAAAHFGRRPWLPLCIGLVVSLPLVLVALVLFSGGGGSGAVGAVIASVWLLAALLGSGAVAMWVGRTPGEPNTGPWWSVVRGGMLITLSWALPVVGWYLVLPLTLATGTGCLVLAVVRHLGEVGRNTDTRESPVTDQRSGEGLVLSDHGGDDPEGP